MSQTEWGSFNYITTVEDKTAVVQIREAHDGGMVEFIDSVTGVLRGCAGINWAKEPGHIVLYSGILPILPDPNKWIVK